RGLAAMLATEKLCEVVAEAADGLAAVQLVEKHRPNILFLDLNLPRLHGLEVLFQIQTSSPQTRVIILSMHNDEPYVIEALRSGAMAYILKGSESSEILRAAADVLAGRRYLSATLSEWAINALATKSADQGDPLTTLSPREREVLQLSAEGFG